MQVSGTRRFRRALVVTAVSVAAAAACGFPEVSFVADETFPDGGDAAQTGDAAPDTGNVTGEGGAPTNPDVDPTGKDQDAAVIGDAATKVDASGCTTCDCDNDGYFRRGGACDGGPGNVYDCDDTDKALTPAQTFIADVKWPSNHTPAYDWNCDGKVIKQLPYNVTCASLSLGANCASIQGFTGDPACGTSGTFVTCKQGFLGLLGCADGTQETRVQACR